MSRVTVRIFDVNGTINARNYVRCPHSILQGLPETVKRDTDKR